MSKELVTQEKKEIAVPVDVLDRMKGIEENLESVDFKIPRARMTAEGFELIEGDKPTKELYGVIIHTKRVNVYYAKPYNRDDVSPPDCFSLDGILPDAKVSKPVHKSCKGCPMAEFGTNLMKSGKACRNLKPLYMLLSDESLMPRQVVVTPASLKAANEYLLNLTERGIPYRMVKTRITVYKDNPKDTYVKLKFSMGEKLSALQAATTEFLKNKWIGVLKDQGVDQSEISSDTPTTADAVSDVGF